MECTFNLKNKIEALLVVGALSLIFLFTGSAALASVNAPTAFTTGAITTSTATTSWSWVQDTSSTNFTIDLSTDNVSFVGVTSTPTTTRSYTFTALTPATHYWARVYTNLSGTSTAATTSFYTLANTPGPLTLTPATVSSVNLIFTTSTTNGNPTSTTYAIYNVSTNAYVALDGSPNGSSPSWLTSSTWSGVSANGLDSPNTQYSLVVIARNGNNVQSATSSVSSAYTFANVPTKPSVGNATTSSIDLAIGTNSNPTNTYFAVVDVASNRGVLYSDPHTLGDVSTAYLAPISFWGATTTISGLSPNTQYTFYTFAQNGSSYDTANSSNSNALYTLAVPPTNVTASSNGNDITVSWSGGTASSYNIVKGSDSAITGQSTAHQFTGLPCGTSYVFKVYGVNGDGVVTTDYGSVTASTDGCGGGSFYAPPTSINSKPLQVLVNGSDSGTVQTASPVLQLSFNGGSSVTGYTLSLTPDFASASIIAYSPTTTFNLPSPGTYTLYAKFYSSTGNASTVITRTIILSGTSKNVPTTKSLAVPATPTQMTFTRNLRMGSQGADVKALQQLLNQNGFLVSRSGPGSIGHETTAFGMATKKALIAFQEAHADVILKPFGLKKGTGSFMDLTRAFVNKL